MKTYLTIYTDGACHSGINARGAINKGGFGVVIFNEDGLLIRMLHNHTENTTNNREELKAIQCALQEWEHMASITDGELSAIIYSDSAYCVNIFNSWMESWCANGWTRSGGKPIENLDIIQSIYDNYNKNFLRGQVELRKVKGHADNLGNLLADALATGDSKKVEKLIGRNPQILGGNINDII